MLGQEDGDLKASLACMVRTCLKKQKADYQDGSVRRVLATKTAEPDGQAVAHPLPLTQNKHIKIQ